MSNYTTEINRTGRRVNGKKVVDVQNLIARKASVFGLTVLSNVFPKSLNPANVDVIRRRILHLVKSRKQFQVHGQSSVFVNLANQVGVALNPYIVFDGPLGLVVGTILATSAVANWDDQVISGQAVVYDIQVVKVSDGTIVKDIKNLTASNYTITDLITETDYKTRVRTLWNSRKYYTAWSTYVSFTTV